MKNIKQNNKYILKGINEFQNKNYDECLKIVEKIINSDSKNFTAWKLAGACYGYLNKHEKSIQCFKNCLSINNKDAETYYNLALAYKEVGANDLSIQCYEVSIKLNPKYYSAITNLANLLSDLLRFEEAEENYKKILKINKKYINALLGYGKLLKILKRNEESENYLRIAMELEPNNSDTLNNIANCNYSLGNFIEANKQYQDAIKIKPTNLEYLGNYAVFLANIDKKKEAEIIFYKILEIDSKNIKALSYLGSLNFEKREQNRAVYYFKEALKINEYNEHANVGIAITNYTIGNCNASEAYLQKAIKNNPKAWQARWLSMVMQFPSVNDGSSSHEYHIEEFIRKAKEITEEINKSDPIELFNAVGMQQPYYIAYSEHNNKEALSEYGDLSSKVMEKWRISHNIKSKTNNKNYKGKIKLGIVSEQIRYHSVWNAFLRGIVTQIDKSKFEVHIFYTKDYIDNETQLAKNNSEKFHYGNKSISNWCEIIIDSELDILFYPEIGMGVMPFKLACMRLCDVQMTSWGHPETSGLPTMDYYLSSELLESENSQIYYREKLLKIPNLGAYYSPISVDYPEEMNLKYINNNNSKRLLCLGAPNKYMPAYDFIFIEIIKKYSNVKFVFMQDANGRHSALLARLKILFSLNNLNISNHIDLCSHDMNRHDFSAVMKNSDLMLDSIGFSGFNTAMQSLECGLPIVTKNSIYMRGRNASAILKTIHLEELIVESNSEFIELIIKLISNDDYMLMIKNKIIKNKNKLYNDLDSIRNFEVILNNIL